MFDLVEQEAPTPKAIEQEAPKAVEQKAAAPKQVEIEAFTLDHIRQAMAKLIGAGKRDRALEILAELGVKKVSEIGEEQFSQTMELVNEAR